LPTALTSPPQVPRVAANTLDEKEFIENAVPSDRRYGTFSMSLLWITMMTTFPTCLLGFEWYRVGFSLSQVLVGVLVGSSIVFCYTAVASYMGAKTGLSYSLLAKHVFGEAGSKVVCAGWSLLFFLWYAYLAGSFAVALKGLLNIPVSLPVLASLMAVLMSFNNIFGFKGVTNFARFLGAPALILWIAYTCAKASSLLPPTILANPGHQSWEVAIATISPLLIGASLWGNEPDYWRFGRPNRLTTAVPILISVIIGEILYPVTGWMVAYLGDVSNPNAATTVLNSFTFGTNSMIAAGMLGIAYFAVNDGNLYGAINGFESLFHSRRGNVLMPLKLLSCGLAVWMSYATNALDLCATVNSFLLPCVSIIIGIEFFLFKSIMHEPSDVRTYCDVSWTAIAALVIAWTIGLLGSGNLPHAELFHAGIWPLNAWLAAALAYIPLRLSKLHKTTSFGR
jgi:purine-cytosine permease-like protein